MNVTNRFSITRNQLKLLAAFIMMIDHIGMILLPQYRILRNIGRISFPIFAFFIFEGAKYTHDKRKYLFRVTAVGLVCMLGYYLYSGRVYGNIMITFALSLIVLYSVQYLKDNCDKEKTLMLAGYVFFGISVVGVWVICSQIYIEYGFLGVLLPVFAEMLDTDVFSETISRKWLSLAGFSVGLILLSIQLGGNQYYSVLALPLLALADDKYEKIHLKYFFYIFYPVHLMIIEGIRFLLVDI